jgi:hypothetical protein
MAVPLVNLETEVRGAFGVNQRERLPADVRRTRGMLSGRFN